MSNTNNVCPHCGALLQDEARFCPHCMTSFVEKTALPVPKPPRKKRTLLLVLLGILVIGAVTVALLIFAKPTATVPVAKEEPVPSSTATSVSDHSPLCSFAQFYAAAPLVSEQMGISSLWDPDSLVDTRYSQKSNIRQYVATTTLEDTLFSVFFYNEGEEVYASVCDVTPEQYADAENLLKCVVQTVCNHYITDIDQVFSDEKRYPKTLLDEPFDSDITDLHDRTEAYTADLENGTKISTRYLLMQTSHEDVILVETKRETDGRVLYDLLVEIERSPA